MASDLSRPEIPRLPVTRVARGLLVFFALLMPLPAMADRYQPPGVTEYKLWYRNYDSPAINALLRLAFAKTPEYGDFEIIRSIEMGQGRVLRELAESRSGLVQIANVASSRERESALLAIPIPIDGGLLGFRVCVVMPHALPLFEGLRSLEDLRNRGIRIGQGVHWPDADILRKNDVPVITHTRYEVLFNMLRNNRFDCFARGVSEVTFDLDIENDPDLVIEPNLLLAYPMPSYFFTAPDDYLTAHRVQLGMERAIMDGSFGRFLREYYGEPLEELRLERRQVIVLSNPFLSEESRSIGRQTLGDLRRRLEIFSR